MCGCGSHLNACLALFCSNGRTVCGFVNVTVTKVMEVPAHHLYFFDWSHACTHTMYIHCTRNYVEYGNFQVEKKRIKTPEIVRKKEAKKFP